MSADLYTHKALKIKFNIQRICLQSKPTRRIIPIKLTPTTFRLSLLLTTMTHTYSSVHFFPYSSPGLHTFKNDITNPPRTCINVFTLHMEQLSSSLIIMLLKITQSFTYIYITPCVIRIHLARVSTHNHYRYTPIGFHNLQST